MSRSAATVARRCPDPLDADPAGRRQDGEHLVDESDDLDVVRHRDPLPGETEQVGDDDGGGGDLTLGRREVPAGGRCRVRPEVSPEQVDRVADDTERVPQLVPDGGGELADRGQPLLPDQLLLRGGQVPQRLVELLGPDGDEAQCVLATSAQGLDHPGGEQRGEDAAGEDRPGHRSGDRPDERVASLRHEQPAALPHLCRRAGRVAAERKVRGRRRGQDELVRRHGAAGVDGGHELAERRARGRRAGGLGLGVELRVDRLGGQRRAGVGEPEVRLIAPAAVHGSRGDLREPLRPGGRHGVLHGLRRRRG